MMHRALKAVLAADVAGYSALMEENTEAALADLRRLRNEVFGPAVASRRGRVVKSMGDGWIVLFDSAIDAVTCAMQIQDRLNAEPRIKLRIGMHLGDVIEEDGDVFGDGVNIAARLEALAEPGSVAISDAVHSTLDGALRPSFDDAGRTVLKNIARDLRVWTRGGALAGRMGRDGARDGFPHLAVLPVQTSDERAEVRDLADALTGEFANWLRGSVWMTAEISTAHPAGAYILRGKLRARGEKLRLDVSLEAPDIGRIWATKHDGSLDDGFDWQDQTAGRVVSDVFGQLLEDTRRRLSLIDGREANAQQLFLKALLTLDASSAGWVEALKLIELAIDREPGWVLPRGFGAGVWFSGASSGGAALVAPWAGKAKVWMEEAERLAPDEARTGPLGAMLHLARSGSDPEATIAQARALLRRMPFDQDALFWASWALLYAGDPETALPAIRRALEIMPLSFYEPSAVLAVGHASVQLGDDATAVHYATKAARLQPGYAGAWRCIAAANAQLGNREAARAAAARLLEIVPGDTVSSMWSRSGYADTPGLRRFREGLLKAGVPE